LHICLSLLIDLRVCVFSEMYVVACFDLSNDFGFQEKNTEIKWYEMFYLIFIKSLKYIYMM
jgi:hypothetical protein